MRGPATCRPTVRDSASDIKATSERDRETRGPGESLGADVSRIVRVGQAKAIIVFDNRSPILILLVAT